MAVAQYLVDKSVWSRAHQPAVRSVVASLIGSGLVATCWMVDLELLFSARTRAEFDELRAELASLEWLAIPDEVGDRALEVQRELARLGKHRAVPIPDLVIAATAERHDVALLHYDADFDRIAEVTGQLTRWVVPRGSVD